MTPSPVHCRALNAVAALFLVDLDNLLLDYGTPQALKDMLPKKVVLKRDEMTARNYQRYFLTCFSMVSIFTPVVMMAVLDKFNGVEPCTLSRELATSCIFFAMVHSNSVRAYAWEKTNGKKTNDITETLQLGGQRMLIGMLKLAIASIINRILELKILWLKVRPAQGCSVPAPRPSPRSPAQPGLVVDPYLSLSPALFRPHL